MDPFMQREHDLAEHNIALRDSSPFMSPQTKSDIGIELLHHVMAEVRNDLSNTLRYEIEYFLRFGELPNANTSRAIQLSDSTSTL